MTSDGLMATLLIENDQINKDSQVGANIPFISVRDINKKEIK